LQTIARRPYVSADEIEVISKAKANPTKAFFVTMLTRDISLDDCILDLVDNSIDGAWKVSRKHPSELRVNNDLSRFKIEIEFSEKHFRILDNCGGITLDDAAEYAFTFGRSSKQPKGEYSVGVYGIGMKRAAFKIGNHINVRSTYLESRKLVGFQVPINVTNWMKNESDDWDFDLEEYPAASSAGVEIAISELSSETRMRFDDPAYAVSLRRVLGRDYVVPLMRGLRITVNGIEVTASTLELLQDTKFVPLRTSYSDGDVRVELIAGMRYRPPDTNDPDESRTRSDAISGWYIICNGRVVLDADRTDVTGWGILGTPSWHPQYSGFVGIAFFSSKESASLPMTTTKRSVDTSSGVYRRALAKMQVPTRAWIDYTNGRKNDASVRGLEATAVPREVSTLAPNAKVKLPKPKSASGERLANVGYAVPVGKLKALAAALGQRSMSQKDVGLKSFEYAYKDLVPEGED
jgi:hypothetical protein